MKKVIIMIRTSTDAQQVDDQHREMVQFCKENGYKENQMIIVETQGASAAKVDDEYMKMIDDVKTHISNDPDIDCFTVWHLNRALRNERVYVDLKEFLISHRVQFMVKNPALRLLNEDGSVNMGMELAFSLMATLSKQDNDERKAKFKRAKDVLRKQGKYTGGNTIKFGYKVDENRYLVPDGENSELVKLIYTSYATGKYSIKSLTKELFERGYNVSYGMINHIIYDRSYIDGPYESFISRELWEKVESVRKNNSMYMPRGHKFAFGSGIFRCYGCGRSMIAEYVHYKCWHRDRFSHTSTCPNNSTLRIDMIDGLLWWIAQKEHVKYLMWMDSEKKKEYEDKIKILKEKIATLQKKIDSVELKKNRIIESYIEGLISKEEKEKKLAKAISDTRMDIDTITSYNEQIEGFKKVLEGSDDEYLDLSKLGDIYSGVVSEKNLKIMQEIVHKHIRKITSLPCYFGKDRNKRTPKMNAQLLTVETVLGGTQKYYYVPRFYKGYNFYFYREDDREIPILNLQKIIR